MRSTTSVFTLSMLAGLVSACTGVIGDPGPNDELPPGTDPGGQPVQCVDVSPAPMRRLTTLQYQNSVRDLLGVSTTASGSLPEDETVAETFASNWESAVSDAHVRGYMNAAEDLARQATADLDRLLPCDRSAGRSCAEDLARTLGERAWRRPLTDEDVSLLLELFDVGDGFDDGVRLMLTGMLQAPDFLYLVEERSADSTGAGLGWLSDHQVATRLSYFLWDTLPDEELLAAAAAGELRSVEQLEAQTRRMLLDPRALPVLESFHRQWLGLMPSEPSATDPNRELRLAMAEDTRRFVQHVIIDGDARVETLLTSTTAFVDPVLAEHYGVNMTSAGVHQVELDPAERTGLLTRGDFLTSHPPPDAIVHRGVAVLERVFCATLAPPPPEAAESGDDRSDPATVCYGCHSRIDPIGSAFTQYDALGRFRTDVDGEPVDGSGALPLSDGSEVRGGVEASDALAASAEVHDCVAEQWVRFATGRLPGSRDDCSLDHIRDDFAAQGGDVRELIVSIVRSEMFRATGQEEL